MRTMVLLLSALALTACDRTPVDPAAEALDAARLLFGDDAAEQAAKPLSLPGLLHAAILRAYTEHGPVAARGLVADLRRLQELERTAADDGAAETAAARRHAMHAAQLGIVLRVFGEEIVERSIRIVQADADRAGERVAQLDHRADASRARARLAQAAELLTDAAAAYESGAHQPALDAVTHAAALVDEAHGVVREALRVPGLADLFEDAVRQRGADLTTHARLEAEARQAVSEADRVTAHRALAAVRQEEIAIVLGTYGTAVVDRMLDRAESAAAELRPAVDAAGADGADITRLLRMEGTVRDLLGRARAALRSGDATTALDLGGHGVSLLNAARAAAESS